MSSENGETIVKKRKLESGDNNELQVLGTSPVALKDFRLIGVLNDLPQSKSVFIHGKFEGCDDDAVVILEKTAFSTDTVSAILTEDSKLKHTLQNDIYGTYEMYPKVEKNGIKMTVMYPASQKHLAKYTAQEAFLISESGNDYNFITLPYIESEMFSLQWVYNILEKKKEADRIIYEDPDLVDGFIMVLDMKWDGTQLENLYTVAICQRRDLRSLRSLNRDHLPLLKNILTSGKKAIKERYGISEDKLRIYVHYQPSYYHFHVHFTHLKFDAPGTGVERAHLLSDVIENIELVGDYYEKKTLCYILRGSDKLLKKFQEAREKSVV